MLRALSEEADQHFQGLAAAARFFRGSMHSKRCRRLRELDAAFALLRHITECSAKAFTDEVMSDLDIKQAAMPEITAAANACSALSTSGEVGLFPRRKVEGKSGQPLPRVEAPSEDNVLKHSAAAPPLEVLDAPGAAMNARTTPRLIPVSCRWLRSCGPNAWGKRE